MSCAIRKKEHVASCRGIRWPELLTSQRGVPPGIGARWRSFFLQNAMDISEKNESFLLDQTRSCRNITGSKRTAMTYEDQKAYNGQRRQ